MAAGLVHSVTRACSQDSLAECGCDRSLQGQGSPGGGWQWGGCSDHTHYANWFSRQFLDGAAGNTSWPQGESHAHALLTVNQHNREAGRQAVDRTMMMDRSMFLSQAVDRTVMMDRSMFLSQAVDGTMLTDCRCHGVSGSCAVKTCWRSMAPFERVGAVLKERFETSVEVLQRVAGQQKVRRKDKVRRRVPVGRDQLVYFHKSPNYCLEDRRRGVPGTRGRHCSRTSRGPDGCNLLCCGRGYNTHVVRHVQRCDCKFVWCCYVRCSRCESMNDIHTYECVNTGLIEDNRITGAELLRRGRSAGGHTDPYEARPSVSGEDLSVDVLLRFLHEQRHLLLKTPPKDTSSCKPPPKDTSSCKPPPKDTSSCKPPPKDTSSCKPPPKDTSSCKPPPKDTSS
ncbi:Protein Wnt-16 [Merluccius polli]|uniref:Protein Wnt n=1 Tax=Merluccius polli TaxID=89951 RepID=A0AA47NPU5_MERPO|nr:Protein Wnt-16 [Merluccius polli]